MLKKILSITLCVGFLFTDGGMASTPAGFNSDDYLDLHPDLKSATVNMYSWDKRTFAQDHYVKSGVNEGRVYLKKPIGFNAIVYINLYADLVAGTATMTAPQKIKWAQEHYYSSGKYENRNYLPMPAGFDPLGYLNLHADLLQATYFKLQTEKREFAQHHYTVAGRAEGRLYIHNPAGFNVDSYLSQGLNPDLAAVVHATPAERAFWAQQHYINNGIAEGRQYLNKPVGFNPLAYINLHNDLMRATRTMTNAEKIRFAQNHYMTTGRAAGMRYLDVPADFNYLTYLLHAGNNLWQSSIGKSKEEQRELAQHHYVTIGRPEELRQAREREEAARVQRVRDEQVRVQAEQARVQRERDEAARVVRVQEEQRQRAEQARVQRERDEADRVARAQAEDFRRAEQARLQREREDAARAAREQAERVQREEQARREERSRAYPAANKFAGQPLGDNEADVEVVEYSGTSKASFLYGRIIAEGRNFRTFNDPTTYDKLNEEVFDGQVKNRIFKFNKDLVAIHPDQWARFWVVNESMERPPVGTGMFRVSVNPGKQRKSVYKDETYRIYGNEINTTTYVMMATPK
jgi:hypothetical protein